MIKIDYTSNWNPGTKRQQSKAFKKWFNQIQKRYGNNNIKQHNDLR